MSRLVNQERSAGPAKVTPPRVGYAHPRDRLLRLLRGTRQGSIWISAPAGSGKTTLAATYVAALECRALWYQLDPGDSDPASFFHYLALASRRLAPRARWNLPSLTPEYSLGLPAFSRGFFERVYARLKPPIVLVFDNQQNVARGSPVLACLADAIESAPEGVRIVVASREDPPPALAHLRANGALAYVGWDELRLTEQESLEIAKRLNDNVLGSASRDTVRDVAREAGGWAAGIVLLLEAKRLAGGGYPAGGSSRETLFDYFASQLFDRAEPRMQELLMISALLPEMSAAALERLTGDARIEQRLAELFRCNYFVTRTTVAPPTYEYHALFRDFLLERGTRTWTAARLAEWQRDAALALLETGQGVAAVELLLRAQAWSDAAREVLRLAPELAAQGRFGVLQQWLTVLPHPVVAADPWLRYWSASSLATTNPPRSLRYLESAFSDFSRSANAVGLYMTFADAVRVIWMAGSSYPEIDAWLDRLEALAEARIAMPTIEIEARVLESVLMAFYFRRLGDPRVQKWVARGRVVVEQVSDPLLRGALLAALGWHYYYGLGSYRAWLRQLTALLEAGRADDPPLYHLYLWLSLAFGHYFSGDFEDALRDVDAGLKLAKASGVHVLDALLHGTRVQAALGLGDIDSADVGIRDMRAALSMMPNPLAGTLECCVSCWRKLLDPDGVPEAVESGREVVEYAARVGASYPIVASRHLLAQALLAAGQEEEALRWLQQARLAWPGGEHEHQAYQVELAEAWVHLKRGYRERALERLRRAFARGEAIGYGSPLASRPGFLYPLLQLAFEANVGTEFAQRLIRQGKLAPLPPADLPDNWPVPIRVRALGTFEVLIEGAPLDAGPLQRNRPLELLKALLALGSTNVSLERLAGSLWPDAPGDRANTALHTTLHRLRKLLQREDAVLLKDAHLTLNERVVWVDAWAAEALVDRIEASLADEENDAAGLVQLERRMRAIYRGRFLEHEPERAWALRLQQDLHRRVRGACLALGRRWQGLGHHDRVIDAYQSALDLDPLSEGLHRELMRAHAEHGDFADALSVYERCKKTLSLNLGVAPGPATEALHQAIRGRIAGA